MVANIRLRRRHRLRRLPRQRRLPPLLRRRRRRRRLRRLLLRRRLLARLLLLLRKRLLRLLAVKQMPYLLRSFLAVTAAIMFTTLRYNKIMGVFLRGIR